MKTSDRLNALDRRVLGPYKPLTLIRVRNMLVIYLAGGLASWYFTGAESAAMLLMGTLTGLTVTLLVMTLGRPDRG